MTKNLEFRVEAADEDVTVTLLGTALMVKYRKADNQTGLSCFINEGMTALQSTTCTFLLVLGSSPMQKRKS